MLLERILKSSLRFYLIIIILSLIPLYSIFSTTNLFHTHDGLVHLPRIAAYFKSLKDFQIPIRWAGDLNYGFGVPLFNFIYQLPYFLASIFLFLGFGLVNSFKIVIALSFILSGVSMFAFSKSFFKDDKKAILITLFYQFAPFRFIEILTRGSFGEVYTYAFLPLVLYSFTLFMQKPNFKKFFFTSVAIALLILSHNALSLVFFFVAFLFILFFFKDKKNFFLGFFSFPTGLFLSAFYWVPAIFEHKYTHGDLYMRNVYASHFPPIQNFFIPNFTNSLIFQTEKISVQFGFFHVLAIIFSILILLFHKKVNILLKKVILFGLVLFLGSLFFMQPASKIFWEKFPLLRQFQFPWRFLAVEVFATSLLSVSFLYITIFKNKIFYFLLLFILIASTAFYWKPPEGFDKINEAYYWNFPLNTTYYGETDVIWSAGPAKSYPKQRIEVIGGEAIIKNFSKKSNIHTFFVEAKTKVQLVDHTQYFPGWKVFIDNKQTQVQFQDPNWRGEITFLVPKGIHNIKVVFEESPIRFFSDMISLLAIIFFLIVLIIKIKFKK